MRCEEEIDIYLSWGKVAYKIESLIGPLISLYTHFKYN